jgi:hypothetical protein
MLRGETVFVIGAGASAEFGMPVGSTLAASISKKLNVLFDDWGQDIIEGDRDLFYNVASDRKLNEWQGAAWRIRDGILLAHSVDDFLQVHQHDDWVVAYGKAAIAKCILEAESNSPLYYDAHSVVRGRPATVNMQSVVDTWLAGLMRLLVRGVSHADRARIFEQCSFVIFNYDRCVEHFFIHALEIVYNIDKSEAAEIVSGTRIYHPYGMVGRISVAPIPGSIQFGASRANFAEIGRSSIKTYTESIGTAESEGIKKAVRNAKKIVFLGFAFHDQNMRLLADDASLTNKPVIGTAFGMSEANIKATEYQITAWIRSPPPQHAEKQIDLRNDLTAAKLFSFYSKSL